MIPSNIQKSHLLAAIAEIDRDGIPPQQESTRYDLLYEGRHYPPKRVVRKANRVANGEELMRINWKNWLSEPNVFGWNSGR